MKPTSPLIRPVTDQNWRPTRPATPLSIKSVRAFGGVSPLSQEILVWQSQAVNKAQAKLFAPVPLVAAFAATPASTRPTTPSLGQKTETAALTPSMKIAPEKVPEGWDAWSATPVLYREASALTRQPTIVDSIETASLAATPEHIGKLLATGRWLKALIGVVAGVSVRSLQAFAKKTKAFALKGFVRTRCTGVNKPLSVVPSAMPVTRFQSANLQQDVVQKQKRSASTSAAIHTDQPEIKLLALDLRGVDLLEAFQCPWT